MSLTTTVKQKLNKALALFNLRLDTLTAETKEATRIDAQRSKGYFDKPAFPLLPGMLDFDMGPIARLGRHHKAELEVLMSGTGIPGGYRPRNNFFEPPDAEILYLMVRSLAPKRILEVGSGNSTKIVRQAILDGRFQTDHVAIDPAPRADIKDFVGSIQYSRLEDVDVSAVASSLQQNDILFIDSSHEVRVANDVVKLFCRMLPALSPGVVVHVHDIFLPFDYPEPFATTVPGWGEQYMLQLFLRSGGHELLWPGFYLQMMRGEEYRSLEFLRQGRAQSFWFRLGKGDCKVQSI